MKNLFAILFLFLPFAEVAEGKTGIMGKEEMIKQSDLIAVVEIQELVSTDKSRIQVDLIATAQAATVLKGEAKGQITFRIPRFFPCGAFDVSTGRHLVFLKKNEDGEYAGVNWYVSYVHLTGPGAKWYGDDSGAIISIEDPSKAVEETKALIEAADRKDE